MNGISGLFQCQATGSRKSCTLPIAPKVALSLPSNQLESLSMTPESTIIQLHPWTASFKTINQTTFGLVVMEELGFTTMAHHSK